MIWHLRYEIKTFARPGEKILAMQSRCRVKGCNNVAFDEEGGERGGGDRQEPHTMTQEKAIERRLRFSSMRLQTCKVGLETVQSTHTLRGKMGAQPTCQETPALAR